MSTPALPVLQAGQKILVGPSRELAIVVAATTLAVLYRFTVSGRRELLHAAARADVATVQTERYGRATLYVAREFGFGFGRVEAREVTIEERPYAQYPTALHVTFMPKGARRERGFVCAGINSGFVVLAGWGHPDLTGDIYGPENAHGSRHGRHTAFSSAWMTEFRARLAAHLGKTGARVLRDALEGSR